MHNQEERGEKWNRRDIIEDYIFFKPTLWEFKKKLFRKKLGKLYGLKNVNYEKKMYNKAIFSPQVVQVAE